MDTATRANERAGPAGALPGLLSSSALAGPGEGPALVEGRVPAWLQGRLIRTAPAVFEAPGWRAEHWFDGLGMLYAFHIQSGGSVRWVQRLLECEFNRAVLDGRPTAACFGTPAPRGWLEHLLHPVAATTDNANVNVLADGTQWIAVTETEHQLSIDPLSLHTRGELRWDDALPARLFMGAHPHEDAARAERLNLGIVYGPRSAVIVFAQARGSTRRREIGRVTLDRVPYIHSFAVTQSRIVLVLHPYVLNPPGLLWSRRPIAQHYAWVPSRGVRVIVMDRADGRWSEHAGPPFFVFHTVNAFDAPDGSIRLDLLAYPDARIIAQDMTMASIRRQGLPRRLPTLRRLRIEPERAEFALEAALPEVEFEFPMIHHARAGARPHRYIWGSTLSEVVRIDTATGAVLRRTVDDLTLGEPLFVPRPGAADEDDGVLLTVGTDPSGRRSELTVWDARTLEIAARARTPIGLPLGFHGSFA
jgi:carotenoid cleavage dioxygenase-like enzyme